MTPSLDLRKQNQQILRKDLFPASRQFPFRPPPHVTYSFALLIAPSRDRTLFITHVNHVIVFNCDYLLTVRHLPAEFLVRYAIADGSSLDTGLLAKLANCRCFKGLIASQLSAWSSPVAPPRQGTAVVMDLKQ